MTGFNNFQFYSTGFNTFQFYSTGFNNFQFYSTGFNTTLSFDLGLPFLCPFLRDPFTRSVPAIHAILLLPFPYTCATFLCNFCSLLTKLYDILRGNSHWPYSLTKYFTFTIVWTSTCLVSFPGPISFASSVSWLLWTEPTGWILHQLCKSFIRLVACVGSGDPVRVLRLYTTNTLDEVCSIYCWDICTTCRYRSTCYSTGASGPTALSVCSRLCLVANCSTKNWARLLTARVLYCTVPFIATCVDAIGTVFWDRPRNRNSTNFCMSSYNSCLMNQWDGKSEKYKIQNNICFHFFKLTHHVF